MIRKHRPYDYTFKKEAVLMACQEGVRLKDVAEQLDIHPNMLSRWKKQMRDDGVLAKATAQPGAASSLKAEDMKLRQLERELAEARRAIAVHRPAPGLVYHSDQGIEYANYAIATTLARHGYEQCMSRGGNCYDNAHMESFFHTPKT